ncbi:MAG: recombinase family protein [Terricaulis sp.]
MSKEIRCAIYTRKSTEEGLDQDFNSLHAQREACEAYIKSQVAFGWKALTTEYDDGGFSGGSMERPALQRLLADIKARRIDVVVVYKADRLTRALTDFAKIVDVFDSNNVSFVSITQAFNTTTSMGRLTLNVLLSFAQFEREVGAERVRDKIAASRAKGMWTGGSVPFGYHVVNKCLVVHPEEAERVRFIFQRYIELNSVHDLLADLRARQYGSKRATSNNGKPGCVAAWSRGSLLHVLRNKIYIGIIRHRDKDYEGRHEGVVDKALWDAVQAKIETRRRREGGTVWKSKAGTLVGLIYDDHGNRMTPVRQPKGPTFIRYYVSRAAMTGRHEDAGSLPRVRADRVERHVEAEIEKMRSDANDGTAQLTKVIVSESGLTLHFTTDEAAGGDAGSEGREIVRRVEVRLRSCGRIDAPVFPNGVAAGEGAADPALLQRLARGCRWASELEAGVRTSVADIVAADKVTASTVIADLKMAWSSPRQIERVVLGNATPSAI